MVPQLTFIILSVCLFFVEHKPRGHGGDAEHAAGVGMSHVMLARSMVIEINPHLYKSSLSHSW